MVFFDSILGLVSLGNFKLKGSVPKYAATASLNRGGAGGWDSGRFCSEEFVITMR